MVKLTKRLVDGLEPEARDYLLWDDDLAGFGVRVFPSGRRSYLVQYRADGRTRRRSIGQHGALTAEEARKEARKLLGEVAKGGNPSEERKSRLQAPTVASLCDRFLDEYAEHHCKPNTRNGYEIVIRRCIRPKLGPRKIIDVTRADIVTFHHELREKPYMANRAVSILSKMFNLAEDWGLRSDGTNPARRIKKFKEEEKKRYLSDDEQGRLGGVLLDALEQGEESPYAVSAIFLLLLTGCRLGEILTLQWDHVGPFHLELPDSKTGRRRIPLPAEAREILGSLERVPGNPYVIVGEVEGQHLVNLQKTWLRVRKKAGISDVRMHDLRHTYASVAVMNGVDPFMLKEILGHKSLQTTLRYSHLADHAVQAAAGSVASRLAGALRQRGGATANPKLRVVSG
ncbi:tyrosine-type recombinase/integrase [Aliiroseovarius marinus]|uniref:tyrosine-type recombinase/integrase n=1 Tax=Aliiroseovarius marinus TaxID=2500159 RepID=UPI003D7DDD8D